jgi:hypothetical protein
VSRFVIVLIVSGCASENDKGATLIDSDVVTDDTGTGQVITDTSGDSGDSGNSTDSGNDTGAGTDTDSGEDTAAPTEEICDGQDNDADGEIDEEDVCEHAVLNYEGHAYLFIDTDMAWAVARDACEALGYTLVKLESEEENAWVHEQVYTGEDDIGLLKAHTWIGLSDPGASWEWGWTDGDAPVYEYWSGEVVKDGFGTTHFGQAAAYGDHSWPHWLVSPANWEYRAVCESNGDGR